MSRSLKKLGPYIRVEEYTLFTDYSCVQELLSISDQLGRLTTWHPRISDFHFVIKYEKGKCNSHDDALSRLATLDEITGDMDSEILCLFSDCRFSNVEPQDEVEAHELPQMYMLIATTTDTDPSDQLEYISLAELLTEQYAEAFCCSLGSRLTGEVLPLLP